MSDPCEPIAIKAWADSLTHDDIGVAFDVDWPCYDGAVKCLHLPVQRVGTPFESKMAIRGAIDHEIGHAIQRVGVDPHNALRAMLTDLAADSPLMDRFSGSRYYIQTSRACVLGETGSKVKDAEPTAQELMRLFYTEGYGIPLPGVVGRPDVHEQAVQVIRNMQSRVIAACHVAVCGLADDRRPIQKRVKLAIDKAEQELRNLLLPPIPEKPNTEEKTRKEGRPPISDAPVPESVEQAAQSLITVQRQGEERLAKRISKQGKAVGIRYQDVGSCNGDSMYGADISTGVFRLIRGLRIGEDPLLGYKHISVPDMERRLAASHGEDGNVRPSTEAGIRACIAVRDKQARKLVQPLLRALQTQTPIRSRFQSSGVPDRRLLHRDDDTNAYTRKIEQAGLDTFVCLLLDQSPSMGADLSDPKVPRAAAYTTALCLSDALFAVQVPFEVWSFAGVVGHTQNLLLKLKSASQPRLRPSVLASATQYRSNGTPDAPAVYLLKPLIAARRERNKHLLVLTDGESTSGSSSSPEFRDALAQNVAMCKRAGIETTAIAVGFSVSSESYNHVIEVDSIAEMATKLAPELLRLILPTGRQGGLVGAGGTGVKS